MTENHQPPSPHVDDQDQTTQPLPTEQHRGIPSESDHAPGGVKAGQVLARIAAGVALIDYLFSFFILSHPDSGGVQKLAFAAQVALDILFLLLGIRAAKSASVGKTWGLVLMLVLGFLAILSIFTITVFTPIAGILLIIGAIVMMTGESGQWLKAMKARHNSAAR